MTHALQFTSLALGVLLAGSATTTVAWRVLRGLYRAARRIEKTFDLVQHELTPNSGSSLYDAIKRIDTRVAVLESLDRRGVDRRGDSVAPSE